MSKSNREIALDLTLALIGNVSPTTRKNAEEMNMSYATETAKIYNKILETIGDDEQPKHSNERPSGW